MIPRTRRATAAAAATAGSSPDSSALPPPARPPRRASTRRGRGGNSAGAAEALVRRSVVAPCVTCGICGGLLRDATTLSECLHAFCRECIYDKLLKEDIKCCPTCGIHLGRSPLEKLRPDHSLQHIREKIYRAKRRKIVGDKRKERVSAESKRLKIVDNIRKERVSAESTLSSVVDIVTEGSTAALSPAFSQIEAQKIEIEVIDEADEALGAQDSVYESSILNLAPVGRDALSRIKCRDFYSACHPPPETGALIVWQPQPILEDMVAHDQLAPKQDPQTSRPPASSDTDYQRQAPAVEMYNTSDVADNSFHARITVQDDEDLSGYLDAWFSEGKARIMGRYCAHTSQLMAENSKLIEELENERAAALERTRILEERHQRELENERAAAAERIRILEESLQRDLENERKAFRVSMEILDKKFQIESQTATSCRSRSQSLEAENARLYEEVENGRVDNQALMSDILEKCSEHATLKYYCNMIESDKTYLENEVEDLRMELDCAKKEHARYVRQVLNAARAVPNNLETIRSDAQLPDFS